MQRFPNPTSAVAVSEQSNSDHSNRMILQDNLGELQVYDVNFETAKYEHSVPANKCRQKNRWRVDFGCRFPPVSERFPTPGGTAVLKRAHMDAAIRIAPGGV
jgi:hypothetical protein